MDLLDRYPASLLVRLWDLQKTSCGLYPLLCDVTTDSEITVSSIVACWTVFAELLPGNALIKSVTVYIIYLIAHDICGHFRH
jgi:hypothetical protein